MLNKKTRSCGKFCRQHPKYVNIFPRTFCNVLHVLAKPAIIYTTRTTPELSCVQKKYNIYKNVAEPPGRTVRRAAPSSLLLPTAQPDDGTQFKARKKYNVYKNIAEPP